MKRPAHKSESPFTKRKIVEKFDITATAIYVKRLMGWSQLHSQFEGWICFNQHCKTHSHLVNVAVPSISSKERT